MTPLLKDWSKAACGHGGTVPLYCVPLEKVLVLLLLLFFSGKLYYVQVWSC